MHKKQQSAVGSHRSERGTAPDLQALPRSAVESGLSPALKGKTCSASPQDGNVVLPILDTPFLVPDLKNVPPMMQVEYLQSPIENHLYGITITPSEKPPATSLS